jgi:phosphatidylglycerophosphate synthase
LADQKNVLSQEKHELGFEPVICFTGESKVALFGLTPRQRIERQLLKLGLKDVRSLEEAKTLGRPILLFRADAVIDQPLLPMLIKRPDLLLLASNSETPLAVHANVRNVEEALAILEGKQKPKDGGNFLMRTPDKLDAAFWKSLRKKETPYALQVDEGSKDTVAWRMFMGTYKGATDLVTKHLWPRPAFYATRWLAPRGISPNMVTIVGIILVFLSFYLFLKGEFAWGLLAAWVMTFLDTVDGKLARTTLTLSKWGDFLDHGVDLVHPPFWYVAWGLGLGAAGFAWSASLFWWVIAAILAGYVLQRLMEGIAIKWLGLEIHIWRPIDTLFRQITARRNPNLILLTLGTLIGRPDWGLIAVALWTVICLVLHGIQLAQGLAAKRTAPLTSWMSRKS